MSSFGQLIEMSNGLKQLEEMLNLEEIDEQTFIDTKEMFLAEIDSEIDNLVFYNTSLDSKIEECDKHIKRIQEYKKHLLRKQMNLDKFMLSILNSTGESKLYGRTGEISKRKSSAVEIFNQAELPEQYFTTKIDIVPNKIEIKKTIKEGIDVPGAAIVETERVKFK